MIHFLQKIYYSFKYRKVLKDVHRENDTFHEINSNRDAEVNENHPSATDLSFTSESTTSAIWIRLCIVILFAIPFAIGCGFGFIHYRNAQRLANQQAVDKSGIEIDATIESLELDIVKHSNTRPLDSTSSSSVSRYCNIKVRYTVPDSNELLRKQFRLEDDTLCKRYQVGETIKAKFLPDQPEVIVLNESRLSENWYWASLLLCIFFIGLPVLGVLRMIYVAMRDKLQVED